MPDQYYHKNRLSSAGDHFVDGAIIAAAKTLPSDGDMPIILSTERKAARDLQGECQQMLVEFPTNSDQDQKILGLSGNILDLTARLDSAIDVAHAVTYLHMYTDHPIIHRDIKSSNILLIENLRAKVADFGFARLVANSDAGATHVSTQVKGTAGYLDLEYLRTYQLTEKSDVYSFGVLLVELVSGRCPIKTNENSAKFSCFGIDRGAD